MDVIINKYSSCPKLVPIGTHDGISYFIKCSDKSFEDSSDTLSQADISQTIFPGIAIYEAKSVLIGLSPQTITTELKYGFDLGRLYHKLSNANDVKDTGFYVICNAIDKSICTAFDFETEYETGEIDLVQPEYGEPYGELPLDTQKMKIGIMRLLTKEWTAKKPLSLNDGDPFRNGTPLACKLVGKPAFEAVLLDVIEAGNAKPA